MYLSALQSILPSLFAMLLQNAPFTSRAKLQGDIPPIEGERRPTSTHAFLLTFSVRTRLATLTWRLALCHFRVLAMLRLLSGLGSLSKNSFIYTLRFCQIICAVVLFLCIPGYKSSSCVCVWPRSDPVPAAGLSFAGRGHHRGQPWTVGSSAAVIWSSTPAWRNYRMGQFALGGQPVVSGWLFLLPQATI